MSPLLSSSFQTVERGSSGRHFRLFPKALGEVLFEFGVERLSLSLSSGRWNEKIFGYSNWNIPTKQTRTHNKNHTHNDQLIFTDLPLTHHAPHGAELWAVLDRDGTPPAEGEADLPGSSLQSRNSTVDQRWRQLKAALSGLFCASLSQMGPTTSTSPLTLFTSHDSPLSESTFRYGTLPRESVCTENLAPFLKLLPCRSKRGLAAILEPSKVYSAMYHSIQVRVEPRYDPRTGRRDGYALRQSVAVLVDTNTLLRNENGALGTKDAWSISSLLGSSTTLCSCPLSDHASVHVHLPASMLVAGDDDDRIASTVHLWPESHSTTVFEDAHDRIESYDLKHLLRASDQILNDACPRESMDLTFEFKSKTVSSLPSTATPSSSASSPSSTSPPLLVDRYLSAPTLKYGALHVHITNPSSSLTREVLLFDSLPWFCLVRWSTVRLLLNDRPMRESDVIHHRYQPAERIRQEPYSWEYRFKLEPQERFTFEVQFDKSLLSPNDYPPDVSRGFDIPSAIIRVRDIPTGSVGGDSVPGAGPWTRFYTTGLLVLLPFPDFSMPFNVIAFTSTVLAFFFGSLFNMTYSRTNEILKRKAPYEEKQTLMQQIRNKCRWEKKKNPNKSNVQVIEKSTQRANTDNSTTPSATNDSTSDEIELDEKTPTTDATTGQS